MRKYLIFCIIVSGILFTHVVKSQVIFEAEDAFFSSGKIDNKHPGFTGDGFVDTENAAGEYIEWQINSFKNVTDTIGLRYALGKDEVRPMQVYINQVLTDTLFFNSTTEFTNYEYAFLTGTIQLGQNTIKLVSLSVEGAPNIDHLFLKNDTLLYFKLNTSTTGNGTITSQPVADSFLYGTRVKLTATAGQGFSFVNWDGDKQSTNNPLSFTFDNNYNISALFKNNLAAFPGAEGFGALTTGGRGGRVIEVTNLNDSGEGSLRAAIQAAGPRIVVFRVCGRIDLNSDLSINNGDLTIAGQTAPGGGITLSGYPLKVKADNVIIRFIRCRLGDVKLVQDDAMNGTSHKNIIIDHCSMSWSVDEAASFYDNSQFTLQYCIIAESMYNSVHEKGPHGYGGIWGGKQVTFHHNLIAHNTSRNPRFCGSRYSNQPDAELVDFTNNVVFNWGSNSIYGAEGGNYNIVNNYFKPGPATKSSVKSRIIAPNADDGKNNQPAGVWGRFFVAGNYMAGAENVTTNNWIGVHVNSSIVQQIKSELPFDADSITTNLPLTAFEHVVAQAGCILPQRDTIDKRIIAETVTGKPLYGGIWGEGSGIIDSQDDAGGWPEILPEQPYADADHDGMPDDWEIVNNLDPNSASDQNGDQNNNGYSNIEDFLNAKAAQFTYILRPVNVKWNLKNSQQVELTWEDITDNETAFIIERMKNNEGYVLIDVLEANTQSFTDVITPDDTWSYRLRAVNQTDTSFYTEPLVINLSFKDEKKAQQNPSVMVTPNPFNQSINIYFEQDKYINAHVGLYNILGLNVIGPVKTGDLHVSIDTNELPSGFYMLEVDGAGHRETFRLIKQ